MHFLIHSIDVVRWQAHIILFAATLYILPPPKAIHSLLKEKCSIGNKFCAFSEKAAMWSDAVLVESVVWLSWHCMLGLLLHSFQIYYQRDNIADFLPFNFLACTWINIYTWKLAKNPKTCAFKVLFCILTVQFSLDNFFISAMKAILIKRA